MINLLSSLSKTVHTSIALAIILFLGFFIKMAVLALMPYFGVGWQDILMFLLV